MSRGLIYKNYKLFIEGNQAKVQETEPPFILCSATCEANRVTLEIDITEYLNLKIT